jgi:hypothetical protein
MIIPLLARNTTPSSPTTDNASNHTHSSLVHRNLVGVLVIAALLALALALSLCFAKWSKPIRRFLRHERSSSSSTRVHLGIARDGLPTLSKAPPSPPPPTRPHQGNAAADAEKAAVIPDSSSNSQCSLDRDMIEIDKTANVQVALPAKVRKTRARAPVLSVLVRNN